MVLRTLGEDLAEQAVTGNYVGIPYSQLDCQGFMEKLLMDLAVRKPDGTPYNWRGSNSMWRNYINWKGSISECYEKYGEIPLGAFLFLVRNDGKEKEKGYNDNEGNAAHVGLYVGPLGGKYDAMDSSAGRGKVDFCKSSSFTHVGLMSMIDYLNTPIEPDSPVTREEALEALQILTKFIKGE